MIIGTGKIKELLKARMRRYLNGCYVMSHPVRYNAEGLNDLVIAYRDALGKSGVISYNGSIYVYNGKYYSPLGGRTVLVGVLDDLHTDYNIYASYWSRLDYNIYSKVSELEIDHSEISKSMLCFSNGVVDFRKPDKNGNFRLERHSEKFYTFFMLPYDYDPRARGHKFFDFLEKVVPEEGMRNNLQEMCGCIFLDREVYSIEKMAILWGSGANGKSTFADILCGVLGSENVSHFDLKDLTLSGDREKNIAFMDGKLLNYCTEISSKSVNNNNVKSIISREPIMCRQMYKEPKTAYNLPLIFGNVNDLPILTNSYRAYARRLHIYPFTTTIPLEEMDVTLASRMKSEYAGIFNWMIEGLERFKANDYYFSKSDVMEEALREFMNGALGSCEPIDKFFGAIGMSHMPTDYDTKGRYCSLSTIFDIYYDWCEEQMMPVKDMPYLMRKMGEIGYVKMKGASSSLRNVYYRVYSVDERFNEREEIKLSEAD